MSRKTFLITINLLILAIIFGMGGCNENKTSEDDPIVTDTIVTGPKEELTDEDTLAVIPDILVLDTLIISTNPEEAIIGKWIEIGNDAIDGKMRKTNYLNYVEYTADNRMLVYTEETKKLYEYPKYIMDIDKSLLYIQLPLLPDAEPIYPIHFKVYANDILVLCELEWGWPEWKMPVIIPIGAHVFKKQINKIT